MRPSSSSPQWFCSDMPVMEGQWRSYIFLSEVLWVFGFYLTFSTTILLPTENRDFTYSLTY